MISIVRTKIRDLLRQHAKWNLDMANGDIPNKHEAGRIEGQFIEKIIEACNE